MRSTTTPHLRSSNNNNNNHTPNNNSFLSYYIPFRTTHNNIKWNSYAISITLFLLITCWLIFFIQTIFNISTYNNNAAEQNQIHIINTNKPQTATTSIISSCKGRYDALLQTIPTWLNTLNVEEIILVDWDTSSPSLQQAVMQTLLSHHPTTTTKTPQTTLIIAHNEPHWILSRSFNLALAHATSPLILKTDCDYLLSPTITIQNPLVHPITTYYTGNWKTAKSENEMHLNGALYASRSALINIGGYDERIQTYGWDDSDIFNRLQQHYNNDPTSRHDFATGSITHLQHNDSGRIQHSSSIVTAASPLTSIMIHPELSTQVNRILLNKLSSWSNQSLKSTYTIKSTETLNINKHILKIIHVEHSYVPPSLQTLASDKIVSQVYGEVGWWFLTSKSGVAPPIATRIRSNNEVMFSKTIEMFLQYSTILRGVFIIQVSSRDWVPDISVRLRILAHALMFEVALKVVPILIWPSLESEAFTNLFDIRLIVFNEGNWNNIGNNNKGKIQTITTFEKQPNNNLNNGPLNLILVPSPTLHVVDLNNFMNHPNRAIVFKRYFEGFKWKENNPCTLANDVVKWFNIKGCDTTTTTTTITE